MVEYLIACLESMPSVFRMFKKASFLILVAGSLLETTDGWDRLKSCCHHSLKDLCVHTDSAWQKKKNYSHWKDIGNYPDRCIICLKSFPVGCVSLRKMGLIAWCFQFITIDFHDDIFAILINSLIGTCLFLC